MTTYRELWADRATNLPARVAWEQCWARQGDTVMRDLSALERRLQSLEQALTELHEQLLRSEERRVGKECRL